VPADPATRAFAKWRVRAARRCPSLTRLPAGRAGGVRRRCSQRPSAAAVQLAGIHFPMRAQESAASGFAIVSEARIDARLGLTLLHHGVTELVTTNAKDFTHMGFQRVWNPLT